MSEGALSEGLADGPADVVPGGPGAPGTEWVGA